MITRIFLLALLLILVSASYARVFDDAYLYSNKNEQYHKSGKEYIKEQIKKKIEEEVAIQGTGLLVSPICTTTEEVNCSNITYAGVTKRFCLTSTGELCTSLN